MRAAVQEPYSVHVVRLDFRAGKMGLQHRHTCKESDDML